MHPRFFNFISKRLVRCCLTDKVACCLDMADVKDKEKVPVTEVLEEDDEFEEFAEANWDETAEDQEDLQQWQDDWDDDDMDDDFCKQLRAELERTTSGAGGSAEGGQAKPQS